jgi:PAS domain S-box-containing protein
MGNPGMVVDADFNIQKVNQRMSQLLGRSADELVGTKCFAAVHDRQEPPQRCPFVRTKHTGRPETSEMLGPNGKQTFLVTTSPFFDDADELSGAIHLAADITAQKRAAERVQKLQAQTLREQKLESLGVMAAGIAHDFNNILMGVLGNIELAIRKNSAGKSPMMHLVEARQASLRLAELANQMLVCSGRGLLVSRPIDVPREIASWRRDIEAIRPPQVEIEWRLPAVLPLVAGDAKLVRQAVFNVVCNATEAIGDNPGVITIRLDYCKGDELPLDQAVVVGDLKGHPCFVVEVTDTGHGLQVSDPHRLFDPFFTTKFAGRGLGLATVAGVVQRHRGAIFVEGPAGGGSRFTLAFPCPPEPKVGTEGLNQEVRSPPREPQESQRPLSVLLVDDEEVVLSTAAGILNELGYQVVTARSGAEAVDFAATEAPLDVVLLDLTMSHLNGVETYAFLRRLRPDLAILLSSGYPQSAAALQYDLPAEAGFVQKPYTAEMLDNALRDTLALAAEHRRR